MKGLPMRFILPLLLIVAAFVSAQGAQALKKTQVGSPCLGTTGTMNPVWSFKDKEATDGTFEIKWGKKTGDSGTSGFCPQRPAYFLLSQYACNTPVNTLEGCPFYLSSEPIMTVFTVTNSHGNAILTMDGPTILAVGQVAMQCFVFDLTTCGTTGFYEMRGSQLCVVYPVGGSPVYACP